MIPIRDQLPTRRVPVVTYALIAANVLAFIWEAALVGVGYERVVFDWGLVPARFLQNPVIELPTIFTSMFMHSPEGWWHLGGNMLFLWIFGDNVEDVLGRGRYLGFYLLSGIAAALAQIAIGPGSVAPMVGASGAIAGVVAAYGSLYPRSPILVINPILPLWLFMGPLFTLPAWVIIGEFFLMNLLSGVQSLGYAAAGGVAFFAHLGGFVAGLVLVRLMLPRPQREHDPWAGWQSPPRLPGPEASYDPRFPRHPGRYPGRSGRW
ncbi:MAG: rhomboid family intramembrane serine protease [Deltaproteobacteria bacterium]|nr:rhomboid family intramembrane serine protease [Deltaproteobacteria bacterium]